ncbi:MAG: hypothetical protein P4L84_03000 [Isosphaeraceae bacterium]|nr:hypothetical protein [Isosphaeraceae bacterium]
MSNRPRPRLVLLEPCGLAVGGVEGRGDPLRPGLDRRRVARRRFRPVQLDRDGAEIEQPGLPVAADPQVLLDGLLPETDQLGDRPLAAHHDVLQSAPVPTLRRGYS